MNNHTPSTEERQPHKIDLLFNEGRHWIGVWFYPSKDGLHAALRGNGVFEFEPDTIAYTDTWSIVDSIENGIGDRHCAGHIYLLENADTSTIAHEATHMALGILSRYGKRSLPVVTTKAPPVEEEFCSLVGFITAELIASTAKAPSTEEREELATEICCLYNRINKEAHEKGEKRGDVFGAIADFILSDRQATAKASEEAVVEKIRPLLVDENDFPQNIDNYWTYPKIRNRLRADLRKALNIDQQPEVTEEFTPEDNGTICRSCGYAAWRHANPSHPCKKFIGTTPIGGDQEGR